MSMKGISIWFLFFGLLVLKGQDYPTFQKIHQEILLKYPDLNNKEIFVSTVPPGEDVKAQWQKTQFTFGQAKLKGGRSGFQIVLLYIDGRVQDEITLKNKYENAGFRILAVGEDEFQKLNAVHNVLLDNEGKMMESGLKVNELFNRILNHITR